MAPLDAQIMLRISQHQVVHYSHHPHYLAAPWRHSGVTSAPPQGHLLMHPCFAYPLHSPYSRLSLHYIKDSSTHYRMTPSPLPKRNQRPHIHGVMVYCYTTLLYTYLKLSASMFYECTMTTASPVTLVLQEHSNYYRAITGFLECHLTLSNMFLLATSALAPSLLNI